MKQLIPLGEYILLRPSLADEQTSSGLYIPDSAKEKPNKGKVLAVANSKEIQIGDTVYYKKYAGDIFKMGEEELVVVREDALIAKEA